MASASPIFLMARATSTKLWLCHQRLSHLNFDTINDLAKNDLVTGLPKFKYHKEHLCPSCEQGKSKRASHTPKPVPKSKQRLHLFHMDLCGPMRIASINGKRYVLVIVDDYSLFRLKKTAQKKLVVKDRSTLMDGIHNGTSVKFNSIKDAKKLAGSNMKISCSKLENADKLLIGFKAYESVGAFSDEKLSQEDVNQKAPRNQDNRNKESSRRSVPVETFTSIDLVSCDGLGGYDLSDQEYEGPNYVLMAFSSSIPPPYTGNFMPPTPDLSFTGLDEFVNEPIVENCKAMSSKEEPKVVRKCDDAPSIKEWVLDDEEEDVSQPKTEKKTVRPSIVKKELDQEVIDSGCSRHMTGNMSYLIDYEEIDGGYVAFGGNPKGGKITGKGKAAQSLLTMYCLVVTDDYSRFTWVFFLDSKDETSGILKSFITRIENLVDHKVKVIRCDNGTEFKNREMNQFCEMKGILRQFSVARTPQQNGVAKRRNRTLIEAARTMLADSKLPTTFWAEAVNTACYVQNRVLVVKPYTRPIVTLFMNKDSGKNLHIRFSESTPNVVGTQSNGFAGTKASNNAGQARKETKPVKGYILLPLWTVDPPYSQDPKISHDDGSKLSSDDGKKVDEDPRKDSEYDSIFDFSRDDEDDGAVEDMNNLDTTIQVSPNPTTRIHKDHPLDQVIGDL
ncbi:ribonuclease H-like domain-containing protein [Tanacetum coccineum]